MTHAELSSFTPRQLTEYTHYQLSMVVLLKCIIDRTQADVERVLYLNCQYISGKITDVEKAEWHSNLKGALNVSDLNRIEGNVEKVAALVAASVKIKSWALGDIPRVSDYERILKNLTAIRNAWFTSSNVPETPIQPLNTFQKWNDVERILADVAYVFDRTLRNYDYCGEIYAGEGIGVI